jgi:hypothetical protein
VPTVVLNGEVEEELYLQQPERYEAKSWGCRQVCRLRKALYGLNQSPRQWQQRLQQELDAWDLCAVMQMQVCIVRTLRMGQVVHAGACGQVLIFPMLACMCMHALFRIIPNLFPYTDSLVSACDPPPDT